VISQGPPPREGARAPPEKPRLQYTRRTKYENPKINTEVIRIWIEGAKTGRISVNIQITELHERYGHMSFNTILKLPECPKDPL